MTFWFRQERQDKIANETKAWISWNLKFELQSNDPKSLHAWFWKKMRKFTKGIKFIVTGNPNSLLFGKIRLYIFHPQKNLLKLIPSAYTWPIRFYLGKPSFQKSAVFLNIVQTGGGGQPMFKNYVGNCRVFWRSFNNMKFAWKGTFEALMVKFGGEIGTLYQIFTPCTPLPKYKRAFTWFLGGSNSLPGCRRIFYRGLP